MTAIITLIAFGWLIVFARLAYRAMKTHGVQQERGMQSTAQRGKPLGGDPLLELEILIGIKSSKTTVEPSKAVESSDFDAWWKRIGGLRV
jgi:hypothetical protein